MRRVQLVRAVWMFFALAAAFAGEQGVPLHQSFTPLDYHGNPQIWSLFEDDRGVVYAGDTNGIVEYDGVSWRRISTPDDRIVRSMAKGPRGRTYVSDTANFGYLQPNPTGKMKFQSLLDFVPKEERDFGEIFRVFGTPETVYFQARERLFRLTREGQGWRTKSWKPKKELSLFLPRLQHAVCRRCRGKSLALARRSAGSCAARAE